jgi:T5SS/PEP-CTERM-associated repeat protein
MGVTYTWKPGSTIFGSASSWSPTGGPPTSADDAEIDVAAAISGTGVANTLNINSAGVMISSPLTTTVGNSTIIGNSATGGVTVSSTWNQRGYLQIGGADAGTLTIGAGGNVVNTATTNVNVGQNAGATGTLTVQGGGKFSTQAHYLTLGDNAGSSGVMTISGAGSTVTIAHQITAGNGGDAQVTVQNGGSLITNGLTSNGYYDSIGWLAGSTGSVTVTGAGSSWRSANNIQAGGLAFYGGGGTGLLAAANGGFIQSASGLNAYTGGTISVDSTSVIEVGTAGGAKAGYLTLDANSNGLYGDGTVDANVIDNSFIGTTDGGPMTINGNITGSGGIGIGDQVDLVLNGSVATTGGASFNGWYGTLSLGDPGQFSTHVYNFMPGDTIDLTNTPYDSSDSSYSFAYGSNGGQLTITEGAHTYTLNVNSTVPLSGALTLKQDASGAGTDVVFTSVPTSPFNQWSTPLPNFFSTLSGPVNGADWAPSQATNGGAPIWVETETPAGSYTPGSPANYTIVLTSQDWLGDEQPEVTVATDSNLVDPFGANPSTVGNSGASPSSIGNLAAATIFSSNSTTAQGGVLYWQASATAGDYALEAQPFTTTYPTAPSTGPNTVLNGSAITLLPAVQDPIAWGFTTNGTSSSAATQGLVEYATFDTATTENVFVQGFNTAGIALAAPVEVATNVADSLPVSISYNAPNSTYYFSYAQIGGTGGTGLYSESFDPTIGTLAALGTPSQYLSLANYTSISGSSANLLSSGTKLRFAEGFIGTQQVIQDFYGNGTLSPIETFDLSSTTPDHFQIAAVFDPNDGSNDYSVLAYTDNNQVHLELLNEVGVQIGSDFVVPGLTSFDQIHTLTGSFTNSDTRVEIDYTVTDPSGGTQVEGLIYDTASDPDYFTLGAAGNNLYNGTPFNDTLTDAPGTYTVNGGGGNDTFVVNDPANQVAISFDAKNDAIVKTYSSPGFNPSTLTGTATLIGFTTIQLSNATTTISETNAAGPVPNFGIGYAVDFLNVPYALGDYVTVSNSPSGNTVGVFNSSATQVASFVVFGPYLPQDFSLGQISPTGGLSVTGVDSPIASNGVTRLVQVGNNYQLQTATGGAGPTLQLGHAPVTAAQLGAWAPIGAALSGGGYEVAFRNAATGQFTVWNTDANGNYVSSATGGAVSGASIALEHLEPSFQQDLNSDGVVGLNPSRVIGTGPVEVLLIGNEYVLGSNNGGSWTGPTLQLGHAPVSAAQLGAWAPIGAALSGGGYDVAFKNAATGQLTVWNTDASGNYLSSPTGGAVSGASIALEHLEPGFQQDLNADGVVGLNPSRVIGTGPVEVLSIGNQYVLGSNNGGSWSGPTLQLGHAPVTAAQLGAWAPIGAALSGGGYEVAFKNAATGQFTVWNTDASGNYLGSPTGGAVSGASIALEHLEPSFQQDLNSDGVVGLNPSRVIGTGPVEVLSIGNQYVLGSNNGGSWTGPTLQLGHAPVTAAQLGAWAPIDAALSGGGYEVAFKNAATGQFTVWNTDASGNYLSSPTGGAVSGASIALEHLEPSFQQDLNSDGVVGLNPSRVIGTGPVEVLSIGNQYVLGSNNGGSWTGPTLQLGHAPVTAAQLGAWAPIGAALSGGGYEVAFKNAATGQFTVWNTDASGNYLSSPTGGAVSGQSFALEDLEPSFQQDLNGDGRLSTQLVTTSANNSVDLTGQTQATTIHLGPDAAAASTGLKAPSLSFSGTPDDITLGSGPSILEYALAPANGIEMIENFAYSTDLVNIDLLGKPNSSLAAFDTTVGGAHAIALFNSGDPSHGVVLLNMPTNETAGNLLASHTTFAGGHALIS